MTVKIIPSIREQYFSLGSEKIEHLEAVLFEKTSFSYSAYPKNKKSHNLKEEKMSIQFAGIDIGSRTIELVIVNEAARNRPQTAD